MRKFFALVKNEYIKLIATNGTWAMVALVLLASVLVPVMGWVVSSTYMRNTADPLEASIATYDSEIQQEKAASYVGWEKRVEFYNFAKDNKILNNKEKDWRYDVTKKLFAFDFTHGIADESGKAAKFDETEYKEACNTAYGKQTEDIMSAVKANDSMAYCRAMIDYNKDQNPHTPEDELKMLNFEYQYRIDNYFPIEDTWKSALITEYSSACFAIAELEAKKEERGAADEAEIAKTIESKEKAQYRIENNIQYDLSEGYSWSQYEGPSSFTMWTIWGSTTGVTGDAMGDAILSIISIVGVFVAVIAGGIVASEYSNGTIKSLLINPTSRWKIITAKYFTVLSIGAIFLIIGYVVSGIASLVLMGSPDGDAAFLSYADGEISSLSGMLYIAKRYLVGSVSVLVFGTLGFAISSLFQSAALAVGLSLMAMLSGAIVNLIMVSAEFDWGRFLIFANTDLLMISNGTTYYPHQTIGFALGVIAVHMVVFLMIAWDGFNRKDV